MLSFADVWAYTSTVDGWFGEDECKALFAQANKGFRYAIEIGCWAGKSSSILVQCAVDQDGYVALIDPFVWMEGDARPAFEKNIERQFAWCRGRNWNLWEMGSDKAEPRLSFQAELIHIDGDHTEEGITTDCSLYLPKLRSGGVVCVHDYGNPAYPEIVTVLDEYTKGWEDLGVFNTLAIRRKP